MASIVLVAAALYCGFQVMRAGRLLDVTIWLALTSALVAALLYLLGAPEVAVIELSVGAGLVTVLFVYAFSIVGEATFDQETRLPRPLIWGLILAISLLLGGFVLPLAPQPAAESGSFAQTLWQQRGLDVIAQVILIFSGVMGLLGLLSDTNLIGKRPAEVRQALQRDLNGGSRVPVEELAEMQIAAEPGLETPAAQEAAK